MSITKCAAAALALGLAAGGLATTSGPADAKGGGGKSHPHHHHFHGYRVITPLVTVSSGCGVYWRRWELTGRLYWKRRYYECIG